uniref:Uncharacterized protein n=1 Tax=Moniliophthora roreri TaxID=221103 RepID=A0A0W0GBE1_MONRR
MSREEWELDCKELRALFSSLLFEAQDALADTGSDNKDSNTMNPDIE